MVTENQQDRISKCIFFRFQVMPSGVHACVFACLRQCSADERLQTFDLLIRRQQFLSACDEAIMSRCTSN